MNEITTANPHGFTVGDTIEWSIGQRKSKKTVITSVSQYSMTVAELFDRPIAPAVFGMPNRGPYIGHGGKRKKGKK